MMFWFKIVGTSVVCGCMLTVTAAANTWHITTVDSEGNVGLYSSLVILQSGKPAIAYRDDTTDQLWCAEFDDGDWQYSLVDDGNNTGYWISAALLPSGFPAISYHRGTGDLLKYACYDGSLWNTEIVDENAGWYSSIAILQTEQPAISYYEGLNQDLKYAWYDGDTWSNEIIAFDGDVGPLQQLGDQPVGRARHRLSRCHHRPTMVCKMRR